MSTVTKGATSAPKHPTNRAVAKRELPSVDCSAGSAVWMDPKELAEKICKGKDHCISLIDEEGLKRQRGLCEALGFDGKKKIDCTLCSSVWQTKEELARKMCEGNSSCEALIDEEGLQKQRAICEAAGYSAPNPSDITLCNMNRKSVPKKIKFGR